MLWYEAGGQKRREIVILENLSLSGVGLFMGVAVPEGTTVQLIANDVSLGGEVRQGKFRKTGTSSAWSWMPTPNGLRSRVANFFPSIFWMCRCWTWIDDEVSSGLTSNIPDRSKRRVWRHE